MEIGLLVIRKNCRLQSRFKNFELYRRAFWEETTTVSTWSERTYHQAQNVSVMFLGNLCCDWVPNFLRSNSWNLPKLEVYSRRFETSNTNKNASKDFYSLFRKPILEPRSSKIKMLDSNGACVFSICTSNVVFSFRFALSFSFYVNMLIWERGKEMKREQGHLQTWHIMRNCTCK